MPSISTDQESHNFSFAGVCFELSKRETENHSGVCFELSLRETEEKENHSTITATKQN